MTEKDFVIALINELVTLFPKTRVRYENHVLSNTHFVEVVPNEVYRLNDDYLKWEENIVFQFINNYPTQNICFLSDDAIVGVENVEYIATGKLFGTQFSIKEDSYKVVEVTNFHTKDILSPIYQVISNDSIINYSDITKKSLNMLEGYLPFTGISTLIDTITPSIEKVGNTQYAMAA